MDRPFSFTGRVRSFKFAFAGIWTMLRSQHNAWIHAAATVAVGAVLISAIGAVGIGVLVLGPHIVTASG